MEITAEMQKALAVAKRRFLKRRHPDVVSVGIGRKVKNGKRLDEPAITFGVRKKIPSAQVAWNKVLPTQISGQQTDVLEDGDIEKQELTLRRRPCPPGHSIGHPSISAGTLGAWVHRSDDPNYHILSNNHVLAASNGATPGDLIIQPGKADGGFSGNTRDQIARLEQFVTINFEPSGKKRVASYFWRFSKWLPNRIARAVGCQYRLSVHLETRGVQQPTPNLVDAAIAKPIHPTMVDLVTPFIGLVTGFATEELGEAVKKTGRTTEFTQGEVTRVQAASRVGYGTSGEAVFDDQILIESTGIGDFSAGGDSGSVIMNSDNKIIGLLFAGGSGVTVANRISNVVAFLGVKP